MPSPLSPSANFASEVFPQTKKVTKFEPIYIKFDERKTFFLFRSPQMAAEAIPNSDPPREGMPFGRMEVLKKMLANEKWSFEKNSLIE